jgi:hypothetical protein
VEGALKKWVKKSRHINCSTGQQESKYTLQSQETMDGICQPTPVTVTYSSLRKLMEAKEFRFASVDSTGEFRTAQPCLEAV